KLCIFAHYNANGDIDAATFRYIDAIKRAGYATLFVAATERLPDETAERLKQCCAVVLTRPNGGLDFASWKAAMQAFPCVFEAEELLLANDSVWLVNPLEGVFSRMEQESCDFWGLTASRERRPHIQSYFLCFRSSCLRNAAFRKFWNSMGVLHSKNLAIRCYESTLTQTLALSGLRGASFIPPQAFASGDNPTLAHGVDLLELFEFPVIKKQLIRENPERKPLVRLASRALPPDVNLEAGSALPPASVLLPTYNGAAWIASFLASCRLHEHGDILICDDGSSDATTAVIERVKQQRGLRISLRKGARLGVMRNVSRLLEDLEKPYFLLADQDDIWEKDKISALFEAMRRLEADHAAGAPLLVYSDAALINTENAVTHPSYFRATRTPPAWSESFRNALVMSNAPGCTMLGNRALAKAALPIPGEAFMHDWWLLLVAGALGGVRAVDAPLVRYRQHGANLMGAAIWGVRSMCSRFASGRARGRGLIRKTQAQAAALLTHCGHAMPSDKRTLCAAWAGMPERFWIKRVRICLEMGFKKPGMARNGGLLVCV
ncbi:MAG: glycosyltransferase, partial [Deltaproteobacteria bacterium]|nr:glycosyltransferase [Deltaproteobacteria bacterium]